MPVQSGSSSECRSRSVRGGLSVSSCRSCPSFCGGFSTRRRSCSETSQAIRSTCGECVFAWSRTCGSDKRIRTPHHTHVNGGVGPRQLLPHTLQGSVALCRR